MEQTLSIIDTNVIAYCQRMLFVLGALEVAMYTSVTYRRMCPETLH